MSFSLVSSLAKYNFGHAFEPYAMEKFLTIKRSAQYFTEKSIFKSTLNPMKVSKLKSNNVTIFLKIYFDSVYYLCCCPFRLEKTELNGQARFSAHSWWPQKTACLILTILGTLWSLHELRFAVPPPSYVDNPAMYFRMMVIVVGLLYKLSVVKLFWMNQEDFVRIVNYYYGMGKSGCFDKMTSSKSLGPMVSIIACAILFGMGITNGITGRGVLGTDGIAFFSTGHSEHVSNWTVSWWWSLMVKSGKRVFFLNVGNAWDPIIGIISATGFFSRFR